MHSVKVQVACFANRISVLLDESCAAAAHVAVRLLAGKPRNHN